VNVFYVYLDWTLELEPRVYYVGKGKIKRIQMRERNSDWKAIADQHGWRREIVLTTQDETYAYEMEKELVSRYNTFHGWGANLNEGGPGQRSGWKHTKETRAKIGTASNMRTVEARERQRRRFVEDNPMRKPEVIAKFKGENHPQKRSEVRALQSGENSPHSRINWADVNQIRDLYASGEWTQKQLGDKFGIAQVTISRIVTFQSWNPDNGNAEAKRQRALRPRKHFR
jgi:hypothetical protein